MWTSFPYSGETLVRKSWENKVTAAELQQYIAEGKHSLDYQDEDGHTALMAAAYNDERKLAQMLLDANANVNLQSTIGVTALHDAADNNNPEIVEALIKAGAIVNMQDNDGCTAILWAASYGYTRCVSLLLDAKANLWIENYTGDSPMSAGLFRQPHNSELMRIFLERGTEKDTGFTALMEASRRSEVVAIANLMELGVDIDAKDKYGTTALNVARKEECKLLLQHGYYNGLVQQGSSSSS